MNEVSYLVTCKNEGKQLHDLLSVLRRYSDGCECVIVDDYTDHEETKEILSRVSVDEFFRIEQHHLNKNYSEHKNFGKSKCKGKWIFQIDADEIPSEVLLENLKEILLANETVELFWLPRINNFIGVTDEDARKWGWNINNPNKWVNWHNGDYQGRILKNLPHLEWKRPLHEKIEGYKTESWFPKEESFALVHTKTIQKQIETNQRYNRDFSEELNRGHNLK
jgi:glycosyltransferase involved in cell wall biosynthesis